MGLDWIPIAPKKDEVPQDVYEAAQKLLKDAEAEEDRLAGELREKLGIKADFNERDLVYCYYSAVADIKKLQQTLSEMTVQKADILNIPLVGRDKAATEFMVKHIEKQHEEIAELQRKNEKPHNPRWAEYWSRPVSIILAEQWLEPVADVAESDGLGAVTGMMLVGADSFRGKCLNYCSFADEIGMSAYEDMTPTQMLEFAQRLEERGNEFAKEKRLNWEKIGNSKGGFKDDEEDKYSIWIAYQAIKWLRFWGGHGFSLHAWY